MSGARLAGWVQSAGPVVLFVTAVAYGVLERHHSNDTWISLAAGRYILTRGEVPTTDPFSYTFAGKPWFDQNWLSHAVFYWLYDRIAPWAVVVGMWAICAATFALVVLAGRARCGSWLAALLAGSVVAAASQHFLSPRPDIVGSLCLAGVWASLAWVMGSPKRRWWPAVLLVPWLLVWGCAHGSFIFGYGMLGLFGVCWVVARLVRPRAVLATVGQVELVAACTTAALLLTVWLGPYGLANFTHPLKVVESKAFREVQEWQPAYVWDVFPPVWGFWGAVAIGAGSLVAAWLVGRGGSSKRRDPSPPGMALFDVVGLGAGLWMAFWARRFAPLFFILATPAVLTWIVRLAAGASPNARRRWREGLSWAAWAGAVAMVGVTVWYWHREFVVPYASRPQMDLLDRTVRSEAVPLAAAEFLRRNDLKVHVMTPWVLAGPLFFFAPDVKVFIDGRAQQVYSEAHYLRFLSLWPGPEANWLRAVRLLERFGTDAVLLTPLDYERGLLETFADSRGWRLALYAGDGYLYLRLGSPAWERVVQWEREGRLWWPDVPEALLSRANFWTSTAPPDYPRALGYYRQAVQRKPLVGLRCYRAMTKISFDIEGPEAAAQYVRGQMERLSQPVDGLDENARAALLRELEYCWRGLDAGAAGRPTATQATPTVKKYWWQ